jgi:hypothetical protein
VSEREGGRGGGGGGKKERQHQSSPPVTHQQISPPAAAPAVDRHKSTLNARKIVTSSLPSCHQCMHYSLWTSNSLQYEDTLKKALGNLHTFTLPNTIILYHYILLADFRIAYASQPENHNLGHRNWGILTLSHTQFKKHNTAGTGLCNQRSLQTGG